MTHALTEIEASFWSRVDYDVQDTDRCWPWTEGVQRGYGAFRFRDVANRRWIARPHRLAYELMFGEIPTYEDSGVEVDHMCHNPTTCLSGDDCPHRRCCNPHHMKLSINIENCAPDRMVHWQSLKTHCPQGHEYSAANTHIRTNGHRMCRTCNRDRARHRRLAGA
jgi:hypothetical protein